MKCRRASASILGFLLLTVSVNAQTAFQRDSAALGRLYIPALIWTQEQDTAKSLEALSRLREFWKIFKGNYAESYDADSQWPEDFDLIERKILAAERILLTDGSCSKAHAELEPVRTILMRLRERNQIEYYPDYLTRYYEELEPILRLAQEKTPATLSDGDLEQMRDAVSHARQRWTEFQAAKFDQALFGFDESRVAELHKRLAGEGDALEAYQLALRSNGRAAIIEKAKALQPPVEELYKLFGGFSSAR